MVLRIRRLGVRIPSCARSMNRQDSIADLAVFVWGGIRTTHALPSRFRQSVQIPGMFPVSGNGPGTSVPTPYRILVSGAIPVPDRAATSTAARSAA